MNILVIILSLINFKNKGLLYIYKGNYCINNLKVLYLHPK